MVPIMACSLVALAIILERLWSLVIRAGRIMPRAFVSEVEALLEKGEVEAAIVACRKNDSMMARVLLAGLNQYGAPRAIIRESIEDAGRRESYELDRFIETLGAVAGVSPLLGLLGTVIGMIDVFQEISSKRIGQYEALAEGIYIALITTAAGLIIAIPSYLFYRAYSGMADRKLREMEDVGVDLLNLLERTAAKEKMSKDETAPAPEPEDKS